MTEENIIRVGLISDTHGLLRPEASTRLRGCDHIIHAGDIGGGRILDELSAIAPVVAVRGNNDEDEWADELPCAVSLEIGGISIYVLHDLADLPADIERHRYRVIVSGHSHKPLITRRDGVLCVNPGSAGRRRFKLPVTMGELRIVGGIAEATIFSLLDR